MDVRTHTFNGKRYHILVGCYDGFADVDDDYSLVINCDNPNSQKGLITIIHEAMHAGNWDKHEKTIDRSSKEIGRLLWRMGWRIIG
jgi:hypothetical protein